MAQNDDIIADKLEEMARTQAEHSRMLAAVESRILTIHDELRRSAETLTRLRLTVDNARKQATAQGETLNAILARLEPEEQA